MISSYVPKDTPIECPLASAFRKSRSPVNVREALQREAIREISEMSHEEYGDSFESQELFAANVLGVPLAEVPEDLEDIAQGAVDCAQMRYLGQCAMGNCKARVKITNAINEVNKEK